MARRKDVLPPDQWLMPEHGLVPLTDLAEQVRQTHGGKLRHPSAKLGTLRPKIEVFEIASLGIDTGYQRNPNKAHIVGITNEHEPSAAGMPLVARMKHMGQDALLPVLDGQQRIIAAYLRGYTRIACMVIDIESYAEQARIFKILNIDRRSIPTAVMHKVDLLNGMAHATRLQGVLNRIGFTIGESHGRRRIKGPNRLHDAADHYGYDAIGEGLILYDAIWPDHDLVQVYIVSGLALLAYTYGPNALESGETLRPPIIGERVRRRFPAARLAMNYKDPGTNTGRPAEAYRRENDLHFARIIVNAYNEQKGPWPKRTPKLDMEQIRAASDRAWQPRDEPTDPPRGGTDRTQPDIILPLAADAAD